MTECWTDTRNRCSVNLIKSEIQVKSNFTFSCKDFYTYVVKEKVLLNAVRSNKKYKFKKKPEGKKPSYVRPHLSKMKFDFEHWWIVYRCANVSLLGNSSLLGQNMSLFCIGLYLGTFLYCCHLVMVMGLHSSVYTGKPFGSLS